MKSLAKRIESAQTVLEYGWVAEAGEESFLVSTDSGVREAGCALSCLIRPEQGDQVLLSVDGKGNGYILSVLERPDGSNRRKTIRFDGQVCMDIRNGGLQLTAEESLSLASREKLLFASPRFEIDAKHGEIRAERLSFVGRFFQSQIEKIKIVADTMDSLFRRAVQRMTSSYRYIEEHEEIQSASTRMLIDGTLAVQTKNTMHTAEGHIKIDAEQIHLG